MITTDNWSEIERLPATPGWGARVSTRHFRPTATLNLPQS